MSVPYSQHPFLTHQRRHKSRRVWLLKIKQKFIQPGWRIYLSRRLDAVHWEERANGSDEHFRIKFWYCGQILDSKTIKLNTRWHDVISTKYYFISLYRVNSQWEFPMSIWILKQVCFLWKYATVFKWQKNTFDEQKCVPNGIFPSALMEIFW